MTPVVYTYVIARVEFKGATTAGCQIPSQTGGLVTLYTSAVRGAEIQSRVLERSAKICPRLMSKGCTVSAAGGIKIVGTHYHQTARHRLRFFFTQFYAHARVCLLRTTSREKNHQPTCARALESHDRRCRVPRGKYRGRFDIAQQIVVIK